MVNKNKYIERVKALANVGYKPAEIAKVLGLTENFVKAIIAKTK